MSIPKFKVLIYVLMQLLSIIIAKGDLIQVILFVVTNYLFIVRANLLQVPIVTFTYIYTGHNFIMKKIVNQFYNLIKFWGIKLMGSIRIDFNMILYIFEANCAQNPPKYSFSMLLLLILKLLEQSSAYKSHVILSNFQGSEPRFE